VIEGLRNIIHQEVQRFLDRRTRRMPCIVDGYHGDLHAVKVKLQPSGTLSGWIQIETAQVGLQIAPNIGDPGWLDFHEDDRRAAVFVGSNHNDSFPPSQRIAAGELFYKNKSGSTLFFKQDGSIKATDSAGASILLNGGAVTATDKANSTIVLDGAGNAAVTAQTTVSVSAPAIDLGNGGALHQLVTDAIQAALNGHIHLDSRGLPTSPPTVPIVGAGQLTSIVKSQ
jgi:hypothetical protein